MPIVQELFEPKSIQSKAPASTTNVSRHPQPQTISQMHDIVRLSCGKNCKK